MSFFKDTKENQSIFLAALSGLSKISIRWGRKTAKSLIEKSVFRTSDTIHLHPYPDHVQFLQQTSVQMEGNKTDSLIFKGSEGLEIFSIKGEAVRSWAIKNNTCHVFLRGKTLSRISLEIKGFMNFPENQKRIPVPEFRLDGARREEGVILFHQNLHFTLKPDPTKNLTLTEWKGTPFPNPPVTFSFKQKPLKAFLQLICPTPKINLKEAWIYDVGLNHFQANLSLVLNVQKAPLSEYSFEIPSSWSLLNISGDLLENPLQVGGKLKLRFIQPFMGQKKIQLQFGLKSFQLKESLGFKNLKFAPFSSRKGQIKIRFPEGIKVNELHRENLKALSLHEIHRIFPDKEAKSKGSLYGYSFREKPFKVSFSFQKQEGRIKNVFCYYLKVLDDQVVGKVLLLLEIQNTQVDQIRLQIPGSYKKFITVSGKNIRSVQKKDGEIEVHFTEKIKGSHLLTLHFEKPFEKDLFELPKITLPFAKPDAIYLAAESHSKYEIREKIKKRVHPP